MQTKNWNIVNDEHQKSLTYRRSWIPMNKTGQMRFFVFTGMNPVSFQFNFRWIWKKQNYLGKNKNRKQKDLNLQKKRYINSNARFRTIMNDLQKKTNILEE